MALSRPVGLAALATAATVFAIAEELSRYGGIDAECAGQAGRRPGGGKGLPAGRAVARQGEKLSATGAFAGQCAGGLRRIMQIEVSLAELLKPISEQQPCGVPIR